MSGGHGEVEKTWKLKDLNGLLEDLVGRQIFSLFILRPHAVVENCVICYVSEIKWRFRMQAVFNLLLDVNISYRHAEQAFIY